MILSEILLQNLYPYDIFENENDVSSNLSIENKPKNTSTTIYFISSYIWCFFFFFFFLSLSFGWLAINKLFSFHSYDVHSNGLIPLLLIGKSHPMNDWLRTDYTQTSRMCQSKHFFHALWRTISILISNFNAMWQLNTQIIELQWNFRMKYVIYKSNANWHIADMVLKSNTEPNIRTK